MSTKTLGRLVLVAAVGWNVFSTWYLAVHPSFLALLMWVVAGAVLWVLTCDVKQDADELTGPAGDPTATAHCPVCQEPITLPVHHIPTTTVLIDRTELEHHLLIHQEKR